MSRHISVTLDWDDDTFHDMTGAEIQEWVCKRFAALAQYWDADIFVTVSGE